MSCELTPSVINQEEEDTGALRAYDRREESARICHDGRLLKVVVTDTNASLLLCNTVTPQRGD